MHSLTSSSAASRALCFSFAQLAHSRYRISFSKLTLTAILSIFSAQIAVAKNAELADCLNPGSDHSYLYQTDSGLKITLLKGNKSFRMTYAGRVLREAYDSEIFIWDKSKGKLDIDYSFSIAKCGGGVDMNVVVHNPTDTGQSLPEYLIQGINHGTDLNSIGILSQRPVGDFLPLHNGMTDEEISILQIGDYAPVAVAHNALDSIGSAFHYPELLYKHRVMARVSRITEGEMQGTWQHSFKNMWREAGHGKVPFLLPPGQTFNYRLTIRAGKKRDGIFTLAPYRDYFQALYNVKGKISDRDRRPVLKLNVTNADHFSENNPRMYVDWSKIGSEGWGYWVTDRIIPLAQTYKFKRVHIWKPSGLYEGEDERDFNYPAQMMDMPPLQANTTHFWHQFQLNGIKLGVWWGHSGHVVATGKDAHVLGADEWNPDRMLLADIFNDQHYSFMERQISVAHARGAREVGLDTFSALSLSERMIWLNLMKGLAPGTRFIHERYAQAIPHTQMDSFYNQATNLALTGPSQLQNYLVPGAGTWVLDEAKMTEPKCKELVSWGFTPVIDQLQDQYDALYDVTACANTKLVQCADGLDNDGDGRKDYPADLGCSSAKDNSE